MAAAEPLQTIKEEVTCPICLELFRDPVTSECGHSFCQECIARLCQGDRDVACPLCNEKLRKGTLRPNQELKNIVESLKLQTAEDLRGGNVCETHREPLRFYCKEHETPVCLACERSQAHRGHTMVPMGEAVQEHRESIRQHLQGIESGYKKLNQLLTTGCTYLPQSEREEEHQRLKRLIDNVATLLKVDTEGPRQRFADAASQTQPRDPDWRGVSPGREAAGETESQGPAAGREPGSEREHGRRQASLDSTVHKISDTTEAAKFKVDVKGLVSRFGELLSRSAAVLRVGRRKEHVSPAGQGVTQTESGVDTGRGGRGSQESRAAAAGVQRRVHSSPVRPQRPKSLPPSRIQVQGPALVCSASLQSLVSLYAAREYERRRQDGVSPAGNLTLPCDLPGCAGRGGLRQVTSRQSAVRAHRVSWDLS